MKSRFQVHLNAAVKGCPLLLPLTLGPINVCDSLPRPVLAAGLFDHVVSEMRDGGLVTGLHAHAGGKADFKRVNYCASASWRLLRMLYSDAACCSTSRRCCSSRRKRVRRAATRRNRGTRRGSILKVSDLFASMVRFSVRSTSVMESNRGAHLQGTCSSGALKHCLLKRLRQGPQLLLTLSELRVRGV